MEEELSTKEKIIQAAFSLLRTNSYGAVSLSRIAKDVGISKTAIYRHFKNKDDLEAALKDRIFNQMLVLFKQVDELYYAQKYREAITTVLRFMRDNPAYLNYGLFSTPDVGEDKKLYQFRDVGVHLVEAFFDEDYHIRDYDFYTRGLFVMVSMIDFMLGWFGQCRAAGDAPASEQTSYDEYEAHIIKIMEQGLSVQGADLDGLMMARLDTLCLDSLRPLPPLDKKLVALSNVIRKVGFPNVTVEALANELGMVKSSLYTWFSDKNEMISSLIAPEINMMLETILQNIAQVTEIPQKLYVLLRTEALYFITRKKMLSAFKWIQISGRYNVEGFGEVVRPDISAQMAHVIGKPVSDLVAAEFPYFNVNLIMGWIFSFPVFLAVNAQHHEFSEKETNEALRTLYRMIAGGIS